jgi:hypothetical protein
MGELMRESEIITMQFAVPPRISGPYAGIQLTSFCSIMAAYERI